MSVVLKPHQVKAISEMKNGSILAAPVGTGKSIMSLAYYIEKVVDSSVSDLDRPFRNPRDILIITTPKKRNDYEWEEEASKFRLGRNRELSRGGVSVVVDSWNNIGKYEDLRDHFVIFDEHRAMGSGAWSKSFIKIAARNKWVLLSATPGDTWMDYIPVFIAHGFYRNRTQFLEEHAVFDRYAKFPKVKKFVGTAKLAAIRDKILVVVPYERHTTRHLTNIVVPHDEELLHTVMNDRWDPWKNEPFQEAGAYYYGMRKAVNSGLHRIAALGDRMEAHDRLIVFYSFDYELEMMRAFLASCEDYEIAEYNGHKHDKVPTSEKWVYLVNYASGAEGWNCISTNAVLFYSTQYSWKKFEQSQGRIDRLNTPYEDLYYYTLSTDTRIDKEILKANRTKKDFNERAFGAF